MDECMWKRETRKREKKEKEKEEQVTTHPEFDGTKVQLEQTNP